MHSACLRWVFAALAGLIAVALPQRAAAQQTADAGYRPGVGRLTFGGEVAGTVSPDDSDAFFNYTNYQQNPLRSIQFRLEGQWRISRSLSFLGELRAENGAGVEGAAWYLRWHPWANHHFDIQAGRIPPVIGRFAREPYGRDNPLIGAPLAYQYLLSLRPDALPATSNQLLLMRGRGWQPSYTIGSSELATGVPIVSAFQWDTGVEAHWQVGWLDLAGAVTRGAVAVSAVRHDGNGGETWSGRAAFTAPNGLVVGISGARGPWIDQSVLSLIPENFRSHNVQSFLGADIEFGWGRWLVRAEELRSVFEVPIINDPSPFARLAAWSGYMEARYRIHPRWQVAGRVERLDLSTITGTLFGGQPTTWDAPVERMSADVGYRYDRHLELRVGWQMNWRDGGRVTQRGYPAIQALFWF
jgi:hypothetical protein